MHVSTEDSRTPTHQTRPGLLFLRHFFLLRACAYGKYVNENNLLKPSEKGRRGHFDLVILDQNSISREKLFRSRINFAMEMAFNDLSWAHFANDLTKLTDPRNRVAHGYILWFLSGEWPDSYIVEEKGTSYFHNIQTSDGSMKKES